MIDIKQVKLEDIRANGENPRELKDAEYRKLQKSILTFPKMLKLRPIVVNEDNIILAGNARYKVLHDIANMDKETLAGKIAAYEKDKGKVSRLKGYWEDWLGSHMVDIVQADDLTEEEQKEFLIKDNLVNGSWDLDMLAAWDITELVDWGMDVKGKQQEDGSAYDNSNCEYPLIPEFDEKYSSVVVICKTRTELAAIKTKFGLTEKRRSYKKKFLGETQVCTAEELLKNI